MGIYLLLGSVFFLFCINTLDWSAMASTTRKQQPRKDVFCLCTELIQCVADYLSDKDIKQLRLTHRRFKERVELRLHRLYLSPVGRYVDDGTIAENNYSRAEPISQCSKV
jgi:hypothetical protein